MMILFYITLLVLLCYIMLIDLYRRGWNLLPDAKQEEQAYIPTTRVSVIVPARNEAYQIGNCLDSLCAQNYPPHLTEIIVVDDHSTDATAEIVRSYGDRRVRLLRLEDFSLEPELKAYKKKAIEHAVAASSGALILTTDADCVVPPGWILHITTSYEKQGAALIAAPVRILGGHSVLSIFQILDFVTLQGITGAAWQYRLFAMGNGANLAYDRKAFLAVEGFSGIDSVASGDDMFLMHKISRRFPGKCYFLKSPEAIVNTHAAGSWRAFLQQRIRWASKADAYKDRTLFFNLLFVYLFNCLLLAWLVAGCWDLRWLMIFILLVLVKAVSEFSFVHRVAGFFGQQRLMRFFLVLQPLHIIYIFLTGLLGKFAGYTWKDRKLRR
jgi:cellulose synthase/poly-beta-1,6-N-acetylglucosamine synthase-like glycosyltransferase